MLDPQTDQTPGAAPAPRTHFNVSVHSYAIGDSAPVLVERPDGKVLRAYDVDFGNARTKVFTRLDVDEKLPRSNARFTRQMHAAAVWLQVDPADADEVRVSTSLKGVLRPLGSVSEDRWITYERIPDIGC